MAIFFEHLQKMEKYYEEVKNKIYEEIEMEEIEEVYEIVSEDIIPENFRVEIETPHFSPEDFWEL